MSESAAPGTWREHPNDAAWMDVALDLAREAAAADEAPIGALVVDPQSERILATGRNRSIGACDPTAHAEIVALRAAADVVGSYRLPGLWLYVTLEPCVMCAGALSHARIARLVYGADDAKGGAVAHGPRFFEQPTCHWRPQVLGGVRAEEAGELLRSFFRARRG